MNLTIAKFTKFNFTKGIILAIYALLIMLNEDFTFYFFKYVLLGEILISGIAIMAINSDGNDALPMILSVVSIIFVVIYVIVIIFYLDYMIYATNMLVLNYWVVFQLIYLLVFGIYILKLNKKMWVFLSFLFSLATIVCILTIFNTFIHSNNTHILKPILAYGVFFIAVGLLLRKTNIKSASQNNSIGV